ncbi:MAG: cysteine desulfurase NifS [Methanosarcina thermophila]|jgi:cysteine desulfurase|uniref:Cysteine desulfurase IscS n=3 Tax=Methanosarcina thermophila TaxID=2210 RepID=A0A1I6Z0C6_METTE|nr:cysteine desulfurase NifS [Methanosarcina thermophila]ALK06290.1 MAG: cysteine desulfurase [Methanosarcina sp. 795]AKB12099.1 Cysteine desulfurase [Methanosarcina thermophila TM-1]AKB14700.1 Cysteine desulfurase [Methanosarcina thermophila CHTI-55]NLU57356.1 cysteine desulfurase NifS [Methanosarcina thermophila]SFT56092.1 cysteine desulfurase [Methanosarcina thermophila]
MAIHNCEGENVSTENKAVYMDNSATTPVRKEVVEAMLPYMTENFGNPSSIYEIGKTSKHAINLARKKVADALGAEENEIYFTSGGTESDNWAIKGIAFANRDKGKHIITSSIEHHAVLHTCAWLEGQGFEVTYLPVDKYGMVSPDELRKAIRDDTILISIMFANNEIGTIQPIKEIGEIAKENQIYFHTDAVQAIGHVPIDVKKLNIDLLSLSGHKFEGPKGCGALYIRKGVKIDPLLHGGAQERKRRAGTENVPGIVGLGKAIELATAEIEESNRTLLKLRDRLIEGLLKIPKTHLNGHPTQRLANNVNVTFEYIEGESLLLLLNAKGIYASTGSACNSSSLEPSHVLTACGVPHEIIHGSLRLSLGRMNTSEDVDRVLEVVPEIVQKLRNMSPLTPKEYRTL